MYFDKDDTPIYYHRGDVQALLFMMSVALVRKYHSPQNDSTLAIAIEMISNPNAETSDDLP